MRVLLILILLFPYCSFAQKEDYNWTFADSNRIYFDINNDEINLFQSFIPYISLNASECQATISDSLGNLQFYFKAGVYQSNEPNIIARGGGKNGE